MKSMLMSRNLPQTLQRVEPSRGIFESLRVASQVKKLTRATKLGKKWPERLSFDPLARNDLRECSPIFAVTAEFSLDRPELRPSPSDIQMPEVVKVGTDTCAQARTREAARDPG
jgi:hypothetical protein